MSFSLEEIIPLISQRLGTPQTDRQEEVDQRRRNEVPCFERQRDTAYIEQIHFLQCRGW